jgi:cellulose synthase (UDP-forming)
LPYLLYLLTFALLFTSLVAFGYRRPGEINRVFLQYLRPVRLKATIGFWLVGIIAVFLFVQWLRLPFIAALLERIGRIFKSGGPNLTETVFTLAMAITLLCEMIVMIHWLAYLVNAWVGATRYRLPVSPPLSDHPPDVLLLVPCCDEKPSTLRRSLSTVTQIRYPNLQIVLLENSRDAKLKAQAHGLAKQYDVHVLDIPNRGHKAGALNDALKELNPTQPYLAVIDADQRVNPNFLEDLIPLIEQDAGIGFIQTPQLYENAEETWVCRAAAQQEMLLYDTILEAKGAVGRTLCCGTNFVMRMAALKDVGGWDERSVSEDLMTAFQMNARGWKSLYVRRAYAMGLGPINLPAYWRQQRRWASGNTTVARYVIAAYFTRKPRISFKVAAAYLWSAGYYITALALAVLATLPMLMVLGTQVKYPHHLSEALQPMSREWLFLTVYPLYAMVLLFPYVHMRLRGYPLRNLIMLQGLLSITIPVYLASALRGLFKKITFFEIAPKLFLAEKLSLWRSPQTIIMIVLLSFGAFLTGVAAEARGASLSWILLGWTFLYTFSFGHYFLFALENRRLMKRMEALGQADDHTEAAPKSPIAADVPETAPHS